MPKPKKSTKPKKSAEDNADGKPPVKADFVYEEFAGDVNFPVKKGKIYHDQETDQCVFIHPSSELKVVSSLKHLKVKVEKEKPLTIKGWIDLNPEDSENAGDFSKCKAFTIEKGKIVYHQRYNEE